jgi:putative ABC transport system ATP-binding protein
MSIAIKDLTFTYAGAEGFGLTIPKLNLAVGETYLLLGPSGSGKSTLLNLLAGILRPTSGMLQMTGHDMSDVTPMHMDRFRGDHIGFIFQTLNLIPWLSLRDNIALGLAFAPQRRARLSESVNDTIDRLVERMNIGTHLIDRPAGQLSIGQQQRVAAARALIGAPDIILADEPSSALDDSNTKLFFDLLIGGLNRSRQTLLAVSHDTRLVDYFDHVLSVEDIMQSGGGDD